MNDNIYNLPTPPAVFWREAYDIKNLASYAAPNQKEVINFILDSVKLAGGQSVDVSEYPFYGFWSNNSLNEKSHTITIFGYLRGEKYIEKRQTLIEALRVETNDDSAGFIFLPLWGRFKVVITGWQVDESVAENGQCKIEINCNRAGESENERLKSNEYITSIQSEAEALKKISANKLSNNINTQVFIASITKSINAVSNVIASIQSNISSLNDISRAINTITAMIAQGVKTPAIIAETFSNLVGSVVNGIISVKDAAYESKDNTISFVSNIASYFNIDNNYDTERTTKKAILQFINISNIDLESSEYIKNDEIEAVKATSNFIKLMSLYAVSLLLSELTETKDKLKNYLKLYESLDNSIDKNDAEIYAICESVKLSLIFTLENKNAKSKREIIFNNPQALLPLEKYLSCETLRELNLIEDSFNIKDKVFYA